MSALKSILSVSASPNVKLPSAVIVPVACKLPKTCVSAWILTRPVPEVTNSKLALLLTALILLPSIFMSSINNLFLTQSILNSSLNTLTQRYNKK